MARFALLGLPEDLGNELARVLLDESHQVSRKLYVSDLRRAPNCSAVFICGDDPDYRHTLSRLRETYPDLPVIVVTRHPETRFWLDALDAGAADYCGAPFERVQVRWVLGSIMPRPGRDQPAALPV
jgi:DNA-binding NarL/FixJ family response regulator